MRSVHAEKWDHWIAVEKAQKSLIHPFSFSQTSTSLDGRLEQVCTTWLYTVLLLCFLQAVFLQGNSTILLFKMLYWVFWDPYFFRLCGKTSLFLLLKTWSMFLPAFQSVYCYGKIFLKGGNKSCLLEGSQNPSVAALIERQQSPLTTGGAVTGPTLRATEPSMANCVCSPLQLGMDTPLLR